MARRISVRNRGAIEVSTDEIPKYEFNREYYFKDEIPDVVFVAFHEDGNGWWTCSTKRDAGGYGIGIVTLCPRCHKYWKREPTCVCEGKNE